MIIIIVIIIVIIIIIIIVVVVVAVIIIIIIIIILRDIHLHIYAYIPNGSTWKKFHLAILLYANNTLMSNPLLTASQGILLSNSFTWTQVNYY